MSPTEARTILDKVKAKKAHTAAMLNSPTVERAMKKAARLAGGGRITLSLGPSGGFYAHAFPTSQQASEKARERITAELGGGEPRVVMASQVTSKDRSVSLHRLTDLIIEEQAKTLARGDGKTVELALGNLILALEKRFK